MRRTSRMLCALGAVGLSISMAGPLSAHANDGDTDTVHFVGRINTVTPVPLALGGSVAYGYAGIACKIASTDFGAEAEDCNLGTGGNYVNAATCGTGIAIGVANLGEADGAADNGINYEMILVNGTGVITGDVHGTVELVPDPTQPNPPLGTCGSTFLIDGTVVTN